MRSFQDIERAVNCLHSESLIPPYEPPTSPGESAEGEDITGGDK